MFTQQIIISLRILYLTKIYLPTKHNSAIVYRHHYNTNDCLRSLMDHQLSIFGPLPIWMSLFTNGSSFIIYLWISFFTNNTTTFTSGYHFFSNKYLPIKHNYTPVYPHHNDYPRILSSTHGSSSTHGYQLL